jgi:Domain of unknown function (DUF5658)
MTDAKCWDPECTSGLSQIEQGKALDRGWRCRRPASRAHWLLLVLFVGLQIADIVTTNYALAIPGIWEANPLMALSQARLGTAWWLPKLAVVGCLCVMACCMRRRWPIIFAVSVSSIAVLGNLSHL